MKTRDEIGNLAADFGSMAAELKDNQDKLVSYGRELEATISQRAAELAHEKANLEISVAERILQLNAANDDGNMYICLPLLAQGETIGIRHLLDGPAKSDRADEARMAEKCRLAKILADNIGLGIANLKVA